MVYVHGLRTILMPKSSLKLYGICYCTWRKNYSRPVCLVYSRSEISGLCLAALCIILHGYRYADRPAEMSHTHARTPTRTHTRLIVSVDPLLCSCDSRDGSYDTDGMEKAKTKTEKKKKIQKLLF